MMGISRKKERLLWVTTLILSWAGVGVVASGNIEDSHKYQHILQAVHYYIRELYVEETRESDLWEGAVRGMMGATGDPYTRFLDKEELKQFAGAEEGKRAGIGAEITIRNGFPIVIAPVEGGPAMKAGVRSGDRIVAIDESSTENISFGELLKRIAGEIGSVVILKVDRPGTPGGISIPITRGFFNIDYVKSDYLEKEKIGYIRLTNFFGENSGSVEEFRTSLQDFVKKEAKSVIIDLRDNSGGHLQMAVELAGYFLNDGDLVVVAKGRHKENVLEYKVSGTKKILPDDTKVYVLINGGSASASEIFAGALQDHGRARLVGTRSFGKASVQKQIRPLPDNTAAFITIQKYFTPKMRSIHSTGLTPDIPVEPYNPEIKDIYFLDRMKKEGFLENFKKKYPQYKSDLPDLLHMQAKAKGYPIARSAAIRYIMQTYAVIPSGAPDPAVDEFFAKALEAVKE